MPSETRQTNYASAKDAGLAAAADVSGGVELERWHGPVKQQVSLRLDADVLAWFKREGQGYQTRINRALRKVMREERKASGE